MNQLFSQLPTTIFDVMSGLARDLDATNLGQGFPDDPGPLDVRKVAADEVLNGWNQYPPMMGLPVLRNAIAAHFKRFQGLDLDPDTEVMVTSGATEALADSLLAVIEPGDEVVLFQPMYDAYLPLVLRAGGIPRFITLHPPHWHFTRDDLAAVFSEKTKAVVFNNPHNPCGIVYPREQLDLLAGFCCSNDVIAICDEVWEHLTFNNLQHTPVMALPGMRNRTIKISSAGKIFSLTGWKIGLVMAAPEIMRVLAKAHQFTTFTTAPNLQSAVAFGLAKDAEYFDSMRETYARSRDRLCSGMTELGFSVIPSQGTYFVTIDIEPLGEKDDEKFCQRLVRDFGVAAIPVSAFYAQNHVRNIVRFCFAKKDDTLDVALEKLARLFK
ncbi:MAG: aminotransferase [Beijerinckiaceae bacterium]|jgi:N-succinyldiaminopimelate aminotransferase|nr:aminotransferase [Beijerinckiaceae bacterium]